MSAEQLKEVFSDTDAVRAATEQAEQITCEALVEAETLFRQIEPCRVLRVVAIERAEDPAE